MSLTSQQVSLEEKEAHTCQMFEERQRYCAEEIEELKQQCSTKLQQVSQKAAKTQQALQQQVIQLQVSLHCSGTRSVPFSSFQKLVLFCNHISYDTVLKHNSSKETKH